MADAETLTEIIELVVGMVDAAPGADILAELETAVDDGATVEDLAIAIAANPAWSGDTGLFPDFLPDAIFAMQWLTQLLGDSVDEDTLQESIDELTATLNGGTGRGEAMYATIVALGETTDPDLADAAATLANKTEVAEYYSITAAQSSEELDDLIGVVDGVDETDASVDTATGEIDDEIAANADLSDLLAALETAQDAQDAARAEAGGDIATLTAAITALDTTTIDTFVAGFSAATDNVKDALVADQQAADATTLAGNVTAVATAQTAVNAVTGLDSAITTFEAAVAALTAADASALATLADVNAAAEAYDTLNGNGAGTTIATYTQAAGTFTGLIVVNGTTGALELAGGVTEVTDPGVTALLAAAQANLANDAVAAAADTAVEDALDVVENLDPGAGAPTTTLALVGGGMVLTTPADAAAPTIAEIDAETLGQNAGQARLVADLEAVTANASDAAVLAAVVAILDAAEANGFITTAHNTNLVADLADDATENGSFDTQGEVDTAIAVLTASVNGTDSNAVVFAGLVATYEATGDGTQTLAAATAPLSVAMLTAEDTQETTEDAIEGLADALAERDDLFAAIDTLGDAQDVVDDAAAAFGDAGFEEPVDLDSTVKAATSDDDIFVADGIDSQIISFGGDDILYVGDGFTLNADDTAGDNGDNSVLEVWITGSTNAVITVETSVFGSEAETPETFQITLTGVSADDLMFVDGFISLS